MATRRLGPLGFVGLLLVGCSSPSDEPATAPVTTVTTTVAPATTTPATTSTVPIVTLDSPAGVAAELTRTETLVDRLPLDSAELASAGQAQQRAYQALGAHFDWAPAVVEAVDPSVRVAVEWNVEARRAVVDHAATRTPSPPPAVLPAWTIAAPRPAAELLTYYREAEALTGVPWSYLAAINFVETRFGRIVGSSPDGAQGPMQFLPSTWADCCTGDIHDPHDAIIGAAVYLAANGAPGDMLAALHAYNPNDGYVGSVDAYAHHLAEDERALGGYHAWEVFVSTSVGTVHLPVGYSSIEPIDAAAYVAANPDSVATMHP